MLLLLAADAAEFAARNPADIAWVRETVAEARARGSAAVMLISQADPGWDLSHGTRAPLRDPQTLAEVDGQYQPQIVPANRTAVPAR